MSQINSSKTSSNEKPNHFHSRVNSSFLDKPTSQNIQVAVRVRPLNSTEKKHGMANVVTVNCGKKEVMVHEKSYGQTRTFTYDKAFGPNSEQIEVYREVVMPILDEVLMGYNCTIFAYGQTGTGKTFTMEGERSRANRPSTWDNDPLAGIIPRTLHQLFELLTAQRADFTIRVSYVELYNEELFDLLGTDDTSMRLYDDPVRKGSIVMQGLEEIIVRSKEEVYDILDRGARKRATATTLLNVQSSRSHSVFSTTVHIRETAIDGEEMLKTGKLYLVDLAGSENIGRSGAVGVRAAEAGNINQSLLTLGRVITALVEHARHVPYRESKLTRILQDSLGGKTKTSIIATISPSSDCIEETISTLQYAYRARNITNKPEVNKKVTKKALLKEYAEEIERLRRDLHAAREKHGIYLAEENYSGMVKTITSQEELIKELEEKMEGAREELAKASRLFAETQEELKATKENLEKAHGKLGKAKAKLIDIKRNELNAVKSRDENEYVLTEREQKLSILHGQATELVAVNEKAVQSIQMLHNKLDRTTSVQQLNEKQLREFRTNLSAQVDVMKESLGSFCATQQELGAGQARRVDLLAKNTKEKCQAFLTELFDFEDKMEQQMEAMKREVKSKVKHFAERLIEIMDDVEKSVNDMAATESDREVKITNYEDTENEQLDDVKKLTDEFIDCQFARDTATGTTPSRQATQYRVLRDLANVTPRNKISERFHEQYIQPDLAMNDSFLEDSVLEDLLDTEKK